MALRPVPSVPGAGNLRAGHSVAAAASAVHWARGVYSGWVVVAAVVIVMLVVVGVVAEE
jgi:hypothetical protein